MNFLLLLAFLEVSFSRENCLDSLNSKPEMIDTVFSRKINYKSRFLMERESIHEPIRIHIHYGDMDLTPEMDHYIKTSVVQGAINWFRKIVYINPIIGKLKFPGQKNKYCGGVLIPTEHVYTGVDADVIIYMTAGNKKKGLAGWASTCMLDKNKGYPLAGRLHLETANIENHTFEEIFSTVVHEISHILAFSTNLIEHWTKPNGMLYKKEELIIWNKERGNLVAKLITPKVLQKAREIFGCPDLDGLELETSHNQTMTAHWEKRLMNDDFMVADFNIKDVVYSEISMAVFEDSGWYQVKYNMLDKPIWGNQKGCKFVREKCLKDEIPNFSEFSTEIQFSHCDYKHLRKGYSNLKDNSHKLPIAYQYFSNEYLGSNDHFLDFCPVIEPLKSGNCRETRPDYQKIDVNIGENMCEDCRCVEGDYYKNIETSWHAGCHKILCKNNRVLIFIDDLTVECPLTGGLIQIPGYSGYLKCPDSDILCKVMPCIDNCSGNGHCKHGICHCDDKTTGSNCRNSMMDTNTDSSLLATGLLLISSCF